MFISRESLNRSGKTHYGSRSQIEEKIENQTSITLNNKKCFVIRHITLGMVHTCVVVNATTYARGVLNKNIDLEDLMYPN